MPSFDLVEDPCSHEVEDSVNFQQGEIWLMVAFGKLVLIFVKSWVRVDGPFNEKAELQDLGPFFAPSAGGHHHSDTAGSCLTTERKMHKSCI